MNAFTSRLFAAILPITIAGCTAYSLERHTANQAMTGTDMRYQLVLGNMAKIAANIGDLPSVGTFAEGMTNVTDTGSFDAKTMLDGLKGFTSEPLSANISRNPDLQWSIDPVHIADQIRLLRVAFAWVLTGIGPPDESEEYKLLNDFQVYDDLLCFTAEYQRWFCVGCAKDAPKHDPFVAHCGETYVWIGPQGLKALSEFTLIIMDIATVDPSTLHPNAVVTIQLGDSNASLNKTLTKNIAIRISDHDCKTVELMSPIVIFGEPNACDINFSTPPAFCEGGPTPRRLLQSPSLTYAADARGNGRRMPICRSTPNFNRNSSPNCNRISSRIFNREFKRRSATRRCKTNKYRRNSMSF